MDLENAFTIKAEAKRLFTNKLSELIRAELSSKTLMTERQNKYSSIKWKELSKICKERKIHCSSMMKKQKILSQNDKDPSKKVHPEVHNHMAIYQNNPKHRQKASECSQRLRQNNPEKAIEHRKKFNEDYTRKTRENLKLVVV